LDDQRLPIYITFFIFLGIAITLSARRIQKQNIALLIWEIQKRRDKDYFTRKQSAEANTNGPWRTAQGKLSD
jgi:hypothetical protein